MNYTLAVLTHGDSRHLDQAFSSFMDKVRPAPAAVIVHCDGPGRGDAWRRAAGAQHFFDAEQRGFCQATGRLWKWASEQDTEFVFWLEHDFVFLRPVDLNALAEPLREDAKLAQMQLMRTAVNEQEIAAGGLYEMRRDSYEPYLTGPLHEGLHWLKHRVYFTTNPSLMLTEFMAAHPWPDDQSECEGRFGIGLVQAGFSFGVWGSGEPWVEHVGVRTGFGY